MAVNRHEWVDQLFREHSGALFAYLRTFRLDEDDLYDLLQSTFIKLMDVRPGTLKKPRAWLFTVGRNLAINALARRKRFSVPEDAAESSDTVPDALGALLRDEENRELWSLFKALPAGEQELFRLHLEHGLPLEEVGRIVGRSTGAVKVALHRARKRLQKERAAQTP